MRTDRCQLHLPSEGAHQSVLQRYHPSLVFFVGVCLENELFFTASRHQPGLLHCLLKLQQTVVGVEHGEHIEGHSIEV